ncbi:PH domain-containing protein [Clostridium thermobutyricum]|uniref:PH domain-containing protein n=1 Tax=Clostridium thermobutyricum TaxID=29372 RepID=UPI003F522F0F
MKYLGIILNLPMFFLFVMLGIAMRKGDFDENSAFGYRSKAARVSKEAAQYANKKFGLYLIIISIISLVISILGSFFYNSSYSSLVNLVTTFIPVILLILGIINMEYSLSVKFGLEENKSKLSRKISLKVIIAIVIVIIAGVVVIMPMTNTSKPFKVDVNNTNIIIDGWGSAKINLNDIKEIKLLKKAPEVEWNDGGGNIGNKIFGDEHLNELGSTNCFVENDNEDVIYIKTGNEKYLIGFNNDNKTISLFNKIKKGND